MTAVVLGIDSSTQSTKVEARSVADGSVLAASSAPHPATTPPASEQDPESWWSALVSACTAVPSSVRDRVVAVSVAGQQHGLVLLDADDRPVRPAKLWNDTTSAAQSRAMIDRIGAAAWARAVGSLPVPAFTITKLAWVCAHEPHTLDLVRRVMLPHDYLTYRLSGAHVTDRGDASGTGWFDPASSSYQTELLEIAGVDGPGWVRRLPEVLGPEQAAGQITATAAGELGLPAATVVGAGSGDNMGAALGLGLDVGDLVMSLGTSGVAYARSTVPTHDPTGTVAGFADATGGFLPLVCTLNATKVTDAFATWLGTDPTGLGELALAAEERGVTVVPWFDGERTPNRPDASGSIVGLRTDTSREELALAAHDGVLCGLLNGVDALAEAGVDVSGTLHLIGGGSRSLAYQQRCADLWQRPVLVPDSDETVATGAAVQAAVVYSQRPLDDLASTWRLGLGSLVEPRDGVDAAASRARYSEAISDRDDREAALRER